MSTFRFFRDKFLQNFFSSNQFEFESTFITHNPSKLEVAKVKRCFPILRFPKVIFQSISEHFFAHIYFK